MIELDLAETDPAARPRRGRGDGRKLLANTVIESFAVRLEG